MIARACAVVVAISVLVIFSSCARAAPAAIGFVAFDEEPRYSNLLAGLREELRSSGLGAEHAIILEHRIRRGDLVGARRAAELLGEANAQVAFVVGTELTRHVRSVTTQLPIVFITPGDPVRAGLAGSLSRPGNNLTGITFEFPELSAKRLGLLKEMSPAARRIGVVYDSTDNSPQQAFAAAKDAAATFGVQVVAIDVRGLSGNGRMAERIGKLDGLILVPGGAIGPAIERAIKFAAEQRIATIGWTRTAAALDMTLTYGVSDVDVTQKAGRLIVRVLRGQSAGEIPIEQPSKFVLVINLKAANALGLSIPQSLLVRADQVIQ